MKAKSFAIYFIDRINYNNLLDSSFKIDDIPSLLYKNNSYVSQLTRGFILYLNKQLNKIFYYSASLNDQLDELILLTNQEKQYIKDNFQHIMLKKAKNACEKEEKYYELVILADNTILVVVEEGFLNFITEDKNNLIRFILDCLCYQYKFNLSTRHLLNIYIGLKINDTHFNLIKSRYF